MIQFDHIFFFYRNGFSAVDLQKINTLYNCPGFEHTGGGHGGGGGGSVVTTPRPTVKPDLTCRDTHK